MPSKLALVPEAPEGDKIKAQHSMGADLADVAQEEHAAKKLKPTDGSSDLQTPLLQDKVCATQMQTCMISADSDLLC